MSDSTNGTGTEALVHGDSGNVDKIRDILFGTQMRDYDRRFAALEERLLRDSAELRDDLNKRLLATEQFVRGELDTVAANLSAEQRDRMQATRETMDAMSTLNRDLSERIAALTMQTAQQHREMRNALNEQQRSLGEEMDRRHQELTGALRRESYELRTAKTDRSALAAMFAELAAQLGNDSEVR